MSTYEVTMYGRDDHGHPSARSQTVQAMTPADALTEPGWTVEVARHDHTGTITRPPTAYRIRRPTDLGDVLVERTASDLALWLVSVAGQAGWVGAVRLTWDTSFASW